MDYTAGDHRGPKPKWWWSALIVAIGIAGLIAKQRGWINRPQAPTTETRGAPPSADPGAGAQPRSSQNQAATLDALDALVRAKRSNVVVELTGVVVKVLPDDNDGDRHQRVLVQVGEHTVLIAHNLDLAARVPLRERDAIRFKGEYEYTDRGGVVHWTHRDPARRHAGGWIEVGGKRYE